MKPIRMILNDSGKFATEEMDESLPKEIIILSKDVQQVRDSTDLSFGDSTRSGKVYEYEYTCIIDGVLNIYFEQYFREYILDRSDFYTATSN